jgi:alpha-tubulin suppressor-like RCC1 family protein
MPLYVKDSGIWKQIAIDDGVFAVGTLWVQGLAQDGQLGTNSWFISKSTPTQIGSISTWEKISACALILAIKFDGTVWATGSNEYGELGINSIIAKSTFTQVGSDTDWSDVSCSSSHSVALKKMVPCGLGD